MPSESIGSMADALGLRCEQLASDELAADAVLVLKVVGGPTGPYLRVAWSPGTDWVTLRGMLESALDITSRGRT